MPRGPLRAFVAGASLAASLHAAAIDSLRVVIAAEAGSPLDGCARDLGAALAGGDLVKTLQYDNIPGADGTIALARFAGNAKGDPQAILFGDLAMARGIVRNRSAVTFADVTPLARLTLDAGGAWCGAFAAPGITRAQSDDLVQALEKAARSSRWRESVRARGAKAQWLAGEEFARFARAEATTAQE